MNLKNNLKNKLVHVKNYILTNKHFATVSILIIMIFLSSIWNTYYNKIYVNSINNQTVNMLDSRISETEYLIEQSMELEINNYEQLENRIFELETINKELEEKIKYLEENQPKNRWDVSLSNSERDLLAKIVMLEAGGECEEGKIAVVEVIFNRMVSKSYGGSLEHVLSAPGQFSTWKNRNAARPTQSVYDCIDKVLAGETNVLSYNYLYFGTSPHRKNYKQIQHHYFS